jgi:hypothetical protein
VQQLAAAVHMERDLVTDIQSPRHDRDLARGVVHVTAVYGHEVGHGTTMGFWLDGDENQPNIAKWQRI